MMMKELKQREGICLPRRNGKLLSLYRGAVDMVQSLQARLGEMERELEAVKRERDEAVKDLCCSSDCFNCKYIDNEANCDGTGCYSCKLDCPCAKHPCGFEWRGVCPENTEVQDENA